MAAKKKTRKPTNRKYATKAKAGTKHSLPLRPRRRVMDPETGEWERTATGALVGVGGLPKRTINEETLIELGKIQCTDAEIAGIFKMSAGQFSEKLKREPELRRMLDSARSHGKESLRRHQFKLALTRESVPMSIFLGKQYLGQADKKEEQSQHIVINSDLMELDDKELDKLESILRKVGE